MEKHFGENLTTYGLSREVLSDIAPDIVKGNLRGAKFYLASAGITYIFGLLSPLLVEKNPGKALVFAGIMILCAIEFLVIHHIQKKPSVTLTQSKVIITVVMLTVLIAQIYVGSISNPDRTATLYHAILLYTMALFTMTSIASFVLPICMTAGLIFADSLFKSTDLMQMDLLNGSISTCLAIVAGLYTSRNLINSYLVKRRERMQLVRIEGALEAANVANAAKGNFMSHMSHEIRTPLNAIIGYNTVARNELSESKNEPDRRNAEMKVLDCLDKSEMASKNLLNIINDVLDMSAIESGKINVVHERFDFKELITATTAIFYSQAKSKGVEFEVNFDTPTEEWFVGDQMRLNQVLANLLSNAVKFTDKGGNVKLNIRQMEAGTDNACIHFEVIDTGIGMRDEYLKHIWEPFEQEDSSTSRRFGGTGLGMSITKNLIDLMGGTITVKSALGAGTTFSVDLTLGRVEQPDKKYDRSFSDMRALVVDDDAGTCDYISLLFTRCGTRCDTANGGAKAVEVCSEAIAQKDPYTFCMVDWQMPEMDGIETIKQLRQVAGENLPMIIITAYDISDIADKAKEVGVDMFVSKPLFQSSLFDLLADICGSSMPVRADKAVKCDFSGMRILLVEDNEMNMEIAHKILSMANLEVDDAKNGVEAVELWDSAPEGTYKAILMDVQMPEMDGYEATRAIRNSSRPESKEIPIIAMTADAFAENVEEALEAGMDAHIAKPIDVKILFETLSKYITTKND